jgi:hypothetical protein
MKRVTWFVAGAATAVGATRVAKRKVQQVTDRLAPNNVAKQTIASVKGKASHVVDAVRDGRDAMRNKEAELRARRDGHPMSAGSILDTDIVQDHRNAVRHLDDWRRRKAR